MKRALPSSKMFGAYSSVFSAALQGMGIAAVPLSIELIKMKGYFKTGFIPYHTSAVFRVCTTLFAQTNQSETESDVDSSEVD